MDAHDLMIKAKADQRLIKAKQNEAKNSMSKQKARYSNDRSI
jgi:hypothetical protein